MTYSFSDIIKNKFLEEFSAISISELMIAILLSCILGLFIVFIYRVTYSGAVYSRSFSAGLVLLCMVTSLVILTISSNIVLSLGMVGALSIVRFRTAVKEALDTIFMFWAIVAGIVAGAGYISVAVISTLLIGLLFVILSMNRRMLSSRSYLVVLRFGEDTDDIQAKALKLLPKARVRSKNLRAGACELVLEAKLNEQQMAKAESLRHLSGVEELSFVSYNGAASL